MLGFCDSVRLEHDTALAQYRDLVGGTNIFGQGVQRFEPAGEPSATL
jgi:hypothetical protein